MLKIITLTPRATLGFMPGPVQSSLWKTSPLNSLGPHSVYVKHNSCTPCRHCDQVLLQGMTIRTALVVSTPWQNMHAQVHMLDYTENNNIIESWFSKLCSCIDFFFLCHSKHTVWQELWFLLTEENILCTTYAVFYSFTFLFTTTCVLTLRKMESAYIYKCVARWSWLILCVE